MNEWLLYSAAGSYFSFPTDLGASQEINSLAWTQSASPAGSSVSVFISTAGSNAQFSPFMQVSNGGALNLNARYIQYRVDMTPGGAQGASPREQSPVIDDITLTYANAGGGAPSAPGQVTGIALSTAAISWEWDICAGATYYQVYGAGDNSLLSNLEGNGTNSWTELSLSSNTQYTRYARAGNETGLSQNSGNASKYTKAYPPGSLSAAAVSSSTINLSWDYSGAAKYEIWRSSVNAQSQEFRACVSTVNSPSLSFQNTGLEAGVTYHYTILPVNGDNVSNHAFDFPVSSTRTLPSQVFYFSSNTAGFTAIEWDWLKARGADSYKIYRATDNSVLASLSAETSFYLEQNLSTNTAYGRYVRAFNITGQGDLSLPATFYTLASQPSGLYIEKVYFSSITIKWPGDNPSWTPYEISMSSSDFQSGISTPVPFSDNFISDNKTISSLSQGTTYWFRVRAQNGDNIVTGFSNKTSTVTCRSIVPPQPGNNPPNAFSLASPADGQIITNTSIPSFTWQNNGDPDSDPVRFEIQYSQAVNFSSYISSSGLATAGYTPAAALSEDTTYWWKVKASDNKGADTWSTQAWKFIIDAQDSAPSSSNLIYPANNQAISTTTVAFDWSDASDTDPSDTVLSYTLFYSSYSNFLSSAVVSNIASSHVTRNLIVPGTYYWKISACDSRGLSTFNPGGAWKFVVSPGMPADLAPPSPVTDLKAAAGIHKGDILLSWTSPGNNGSFLPLLAGSRFAVQYSTWQGVAWSTSAAQVSVSTASVDSGSRQSIELSGLTAGNTYYFREFTMDESGNWSGQSNISQDFMPDIMLAVPMLSVTPGLRRGEIILSWTQTANAVYYEIARGSKTNVLKIIGDDEPLASSFTDSGLSDNTEYSYWARAMYNTNDWSDYYGPVSTITAASLYTLGGNVRGNSPAGLSVVLCELMAEINMLDRQYTLNGSFSFSGLTKGATYTLRINYYEGENFRANYYKAVSGVNDMGVILPVAFVPGSISGRFAGSGAQLSGFCSRQVSATPSRFVEINNVRDSGVKLAVPVDSEGNYSILNVLPGSYALQGFSGPDSTGLEVAEVHENEAVTLDMTINSIQPGLVTVFPNPSGRNAVTVRLRSDNGNADAKVRIYTINGELLRAEGMALNSALPDFTYEYIWDTRNNSGKSAASGIYLCVITAKGNNAGQDLKFIIKIAVEK